MFMAASETLRERADCLTSCRAMPVKLAINGACGRMGRRTSAVKAWHHTDMGASAGRQVPTGRAPPTNLGEIVG